LRLGLAFAGTYNETGHEEHCPDINGPGCAGEEVPPQWHALRLFFGELRLHADYGVLDWLSVDLQLSLRVVDIRFQLQDLDRQPIPPPFGEEIHHRNETLVGVTDPWLGLRAARRVGDWLVAGRVGFTVPIGRTVENPFRLGREGRQHQHIQFGTGTVDPFAQVELGRRFGRFAVEAWALARLPLYRNRHGYQGGMNVIGGLRAQVELGRGRWRLGLGLLGYHERAERWSGVAENEGNLGRTDLLIEPSVSWRFGGSWALEVTVRAPVWSRVVGAQLTPAVGQVGISRAFQLP
jgi:hypothetical protein